MWLKVNDCVIDLSKLIAVKHSGKEVMFCFPHTDYIKAIKNSPEAAQALFEHVAALLEAKQ